MIDGAPDIGLAVLRGMKQFSPARPKKSTLVEGGFYGLTQ